MTDTPSPTPDHESSTGRFAYEGLERVIHEKARLGILTSLLAPPAGLAFTELRELCSLTDGNLNRHLKVLVEAGLVAIEKMTQGNRPQTTCRVTAAGRERFQEYLAALEKVIADAAAIASANPKPGLIPRWHSG
ncbi:MAG: transcriptional regulator [Planctomycetaceae bacterium]